MILKCEIRAKIESWRTNENFQTQLLFLRLYLGLVAQLDNAPGYGPGDWGFESLRVHF